MIYDRTIFIGNGKGGTGKTSVTSAVAVAFAAAGRRVLVIDMDPQGDLGDDLGYDIEERPTAAHQALGVAECVDVEGDQGEALMLALTTSQPLKVVENVRPGLDVVLGGQYLQDIGYHTVETWRRGGGDLYLQLRQKLEVYEDVYDLVLIDTPPGEKHLKDIALSASRYCVLTVKADRSSMKGIARLADEVLAVREINPGLELLGVVLFAVGSASSQLRREMREQLEELLDGIAPVFDTTVRFVERAAKDLRQLGVTPAEYEMYLAKTGSASRAGALAGLALDYQLLAMEIGSAHVQAVTKEHAA